MALDNILAEIARKKREEVARLALFESVLRRQAAAAPPPMNFEAALRRPGEVALIAEFKRRSPSAGDIDSGANAGGVARVYEAAGAAAVSVLTDDEYFGGSLDDMRLAREAVSLPLLRKDFTLDAVQLYEARAAAADAVLLIVRLLGGDRLRELLKVADELGLAALVEARDGREIECALAAGAGIVGVNARDLATFEVDLEGSLRLVEEIPPEVVAVAESGIRSEADVEAAGLAGADAVLVGSWLMEGDPGERAAALAGSPLHLRGGA